MASHLISATDVKQRLDRPSGEIIIDLLTEEAFDKQHIPQAHNACVFNMDFIDIVTRLAPDTQTPLILYGSSSQSLDAETAREKLLKAGFTQVDILSGGRVAWQRAGFPFAGTDPALPFEPRPATLLPDGDFRVDTDTSRILWMGRNIGGGHHGHLKLQEGTISIRDRRVQSGFFVADLRTIKVDDLDDEWGAVLIRHLHSDDFFDVEHYPLSRLVINEADPLPGKHSGFPNAHLTATLDLHGQDHEIQFDASLAPHREGGLALQAHFDLDRILWGIEYGSGSLFEHLGMHLVDDLISVEARLRLHAS